MAKGPIRELRARVDNRQLVALIVASARAAVPMWQKWPGSAWDLMEGLHAYFREVITYIPEDGVQVIRMPGAVRRERRADCKTHALIIASAAAANGMDARLRFIQGPGKTHLHHVYAVINGVPVDPLLPFGTEAVYLRHLTIPV